MTGRRNRVLALMRKLERHGIDLDMPGIGETHADEHLQAIERHVDLLLKELQPPASTVKLLEGKELWQSLAIAIVSLARARQGVRLSDQDLKGLVENYCPRLHLPFWTSFAAPRIAGLLRYEGFERRDGNRIIKGELRQLIESEGVLFWDYNDSDSLGGQSFGSSDSDVRIVNSRWLEAHADIYLWVTHRWAGGRRCRFCAMMESPKVNALLPVEIERRHGVSMIGETVVLQPGTILTHERCRPFWIDWAAIAAKYPNREAAAAADKVAGRTFRAEALQTSALIPEASNG